MSELLMILGHVLPAMIKSSAWDMLHSMLEMLIYRLMHVHIQPHYRIQLLSFLNSLTLPQTSRNQLQIWLDKFSHI